MMYWHNASQSRPQFSQIGSDFCSAPAKHHHSHLFSFIFNNCCSYFCRCRASILHWLPSDNLTQHNINSQIFRAEIALISWIKAPLYPGFNKVMQMIEKKMYNDFFSSRIALCNSLCHQNCSFNTAMKGLTITFGRSKDIMGNVL